MKKITGKVVSLVLALALVVTSFSANFAFAAKKTISGTVAKAENKKICLVNGGTSKEVDLNAWLVQGKFKLETKEHDVATAVKVKSISHVSGDNLVTCTVKDDTAKLKLKSNDSRGMEVISVLYEGDDNSDHDDDNGNNDYIVKGSFNLNVFAYDKGEIIFSKATDGATKAPGKGLDAFNDFARNKNSVKTIGIYRAMPNDTGRGNADGKADARATYEVVQLTTDKELAVKDSGVYFYEMTSGDKDVITPFTETPKVTKASSLLTTRINVTGTKDEASTSNVTINVKRFVDGKDNKVKVSTDSDDKYTLKTKIEKKVDVGSGDLFTDVKAGTNYTISKDDGKTKLFGGKYPADVTDCEIVFPKGTGTVTVDKDTHVKKISGSVAKLEIGDAAVGEVDLDNGCVVVNDGKVGNITTDLDNDPTTTGCVTVSGGIVGNINTADVDDTKDANIIGKNLGNVTITGGTVGTIKCDSEVSINSNDKDEPIVTGVITAAKVNVFADEAKVAIAGVKASDNGTMTFKGEKLTIGALDLDYRETTVKLGDDDDALKGTIPSIANAKNAKIETVNEDTDVTVAGSIDVDTISVGTDSIITFTGNITVETIDGDGTMKIDAGKLYVTDGASSVKLKLSSATALTAGTTVFKSKKDTVDADSFDTFGFTLEKVKGNDVDTFKIKSIAFAGIAINKTTSKIAKGYSETFTASAYPSGTALPTGATVKWDLDGGSCDVFKLTATDNTAKVEILNIDRAFESENKTTLTATLYDANGYEMDDYETAKCDVFAIATPEAISDTNSDFSVAAGASYQFKITSATAPSFVAGTAGVFNVELTSQVGNDYFYKITAVGKAGADAGIYLNGNKLLVATVKASAFKSDTNDDFTVKGSYTIKITADAVPTFTVGTAGVFKAEFVEKVGNDYFYKITSVAAAGTDAGIYVNNTKLLVATVG